MHKRMLQKQVNLKLQALINQHSQDIITLLQTLLGSVVRKSQFKTSLIFSASAIQKIFVYQYGQRMYYDYRERLAAIILMQRQGYEKIALFAQRISQNNFLKLFEDSLSRKLTEVRFYELKQLSLNRISPILVKQLQKCSFYSLQILSLTDNNLFQTGIKFLRHCTLSSLLQLDLSENALVSSQLKQLAYCYFPKLAELQMRKNKIQNEGTRLLAQLIVPNLINISLMSNIIKSQRCCQIVKIRAFKLKKIVLSQNLIQPEVFLSFLNSNIRKLQQVVLYLNKGKQIKSVLGEADSQLRMKYLMESQNPKTFIIF